MCLLLFSYLSDVFTYVVEKQQASVTKRSKVFLGDLLYVSNSNAYAKLSDKSGITTKKTLK